MERVSIYQLVSQFNHSEQRKRMIPQELVSGWPCIRKINKTLCITIPYYNRAVHDGRVALYPLYCSVTLPVGNPDRLMDFTIYPNQLDWDDLDYSKPAGYFKHEALADVKSGTEYQTLCRQLYDFYDQMVAAILEKKPFAAETQMIELFSKLMEPCHYPQYLRINKKFYSYFCQL